MEIIIHLQVKKLDCDYQAAIDEYIKRCSHFGRIIIKTYKNQEIPKISDTSKCFIVKTASDTTTSPALAKVISGACVSGFSRIEFVIPDGLLIQPLFGGNTEFLNFASISMESGLFAVALTEQIYRAFTILNNITYHK